MAHNKTQHEKDLKTMQEIRAVWEDYKQSVKDRWEVRIPDSGPSNTLFFALNGMVTPYYMFTKEEVFELMEITGRESWINAIIDSLQGTCSSLHEVCEEWSFDYDWLTDRELDDIDNETQECSVCGWWTYGDGDCCVDE